MKKCELLSPAGNMEMLKYAIGYGADAVYLSGHRFGARKFATNFNDEELKQAIEYAHLHDVKVYITVNTLVKENEIEEFISYVKYIYQIGVDAILVQDFGMLSIIRQVMPNLEIHASTQFHNNGRDVLELLSKEGVKRVVLDREMSLDEIKELPDNIEKEVFCHGALCVSYSGQCLLSSMLLCRSGNRGECAGLCRLPYKLKRNGVLEETERYHLSLKDLSTVDQIEDILKSGVDCLKIEGRMKSPQYVGYITKIYRKLLDSFYEGKNIRLSEEERKNMELLFNRGFTKGFISDANSGDIVNKESPNHIGILLGHYKVKGEKIELSLDEDLYQGDVIRFKEAKKGMTINFLYDDKGNLVNFLKARYKGFVDNFLDVEKSGEIRKVESITLKREIDQLPRKKLFINGNIKILTGKPIELSFSYKDIEVNVLGSIPSKAEKRPISKDNVRIQISKTGDTVYELESLNIELEDNLFVNLRDLNELRRDCLKQLDTRRLNLTKHTVNEIAIVSVKSPCCTQKVLVVVETLEQYEVAKNFDCIIFTSNEFLLKRLKGKVFPKFLNSEIDSEYEKCIVADYGSLNKKDRLKEFYTDYMFNVVNSYTVKKILSYDATSVFFSPEVSSDELLLMKEKVDFSKTGVLIYGKIQLMKMKYDISNGEDVSLIDRNNKEYVFKNRRLFNYLYSPKVIDKIEEIGLFKNLNVGYLRIDFLDEGARDCHNILNRVFKSL